MKVVAPKKYHFIKVEADAGANITVFQAETMQGLNRVEMGPTEIEIQRYSAGAEQCLGKLL